MTGWNMPPGCNDSMIPGNRPEDIEYQKFLEDRLEDIWDEWDGERMCDNGQDEFDENPVFEAHVDSLFESYREDMREPPEPVCEWR